MNPPFEKLADIDHVRHAFDNLLAEGGRLVSIMGESAFFRTDNKAMIFREWLAEVQTAEMDIPAGAFKESGTGVKTRMIVVDKPYSTTPQAADQGHDEDNAAEESAPTELAASAEDMIILAVDLGLLPAAQEGDDPLEQFLDEDGEFLPLYPDDIEAELADMSEASQDAPQGVPDETPSTSSPLKERGLQKALPGTGANDKLLRLNQNKMF